MHARALLASLLLCALACFSEPVTSTGEQCVDGQPGCDCDVANACVAGLECVISIDKCVPIDCTPGAITCTCTDAGGCSGSLVCDAGVCLDPPVGTTGNESGIAEASSSSGASSTTPGSSTGPIDTLSTTNLPSTTLGTDTLDGSATELTDATMTDATMTNGSSGGEPVDCNTCVQAASTDHCAAQYGVCTARETKGGCATLSECVFDGADSVAECCENNPDETGQLNWNTYAQCADTIGCMGMCTSTCLLAL